MPRKQQFKYDVGYKFSQYEIVDRISRPRPNGKNRYLYVLKCLKCGTTIEREEYAIGKDVKCKQCVLNMEYSAFNIGDVINGLEILDKKLVKVEKWNISRRSYLCKCVKDGYTSWHTEDNLLKGKGCSVCAGIVIMQGINDINTVAPWLGKLLYDENDGYKYGVGSKELVKFKCPHCGTVTKPMSIYNVYISGYVPCRKCGDGISTPEKLMYGLLEQIGVHFEYQKQFDWSCGKFYDFYIPAMNMIIETHGAQHYPGNNSGIWGTFEEIHQNDELKEKLAHDNGIVQYIQINCDAPSSLVLINIYKASLCDYFDLSMADFDKIVLASAKSFCIKSGELWNAGCHDVDAIANCLRLNPSTIRRYLKTLSNIGYLTINYPIKNKKYIIKGDANYGRYENT